MIKRYIITGLILNLVWYACLIISNYISSVITTRSMYNLFMGTEYSNKTLATVLSIPGIVFMIYTVFLLIYHIRVFTLSAWTMKERVRSFFTVSGVTILILVVLICWLLFIPSMSEKRAIEIANNDMVNLDMYEPPVASWSMGRWKVVYWNKNKRGCEIITISRGSMHYSSGTCRNINK